MDNTNVKQNEETSLDDMMATSVPAEDTKSEDLSAEAVPADAPTEDVANEIQNSPEAPKEESEVVDPAPNKESQTQEASEETTNDMIEESAADIADAAVTPAEETIQAVPVMPAPKKYRGKWYIVHTYSGHENKVAKTLMQRVQAMGFEERIFDALVPTRDTIRVRGGKKETIKEKIFPGYILVNMDLSDEAWVLVRTTPGVTSFVGAQNKPTPIRDDEVQAIVAFVRQKEPVYKAQFTQGEAVKITDGPFSDFLGTVESIDEAKGKVKVLVSIFGRETPVELDFLQVSKI
jgi:transcriptional antiterminator NusG